MKNIIIILCILSIFFVSCKDAEMQPKDYPLIVTNEPTDIDTTGVTLEAEILLQGKEKITDSGFILSDGKIELKYNAFNAENTEKIECRVSSDIVKNVIYTCKAFIRTSKHLVYGTSVTFKSLGSSVHQISDFSPKSGFDGDTITITGKNFSQILYVNKVLVNNVAANILKISNTKLVITTRNQAATGEVDINVIVNDIKVKASDKYTIIGPKIIGLSKNSAKSGEKITIYGENLLKNGSRIEVNFNSYLAVILNKSNDSVEVVVPVATNDYITKIKLTSGLKTVTYDEYFVIKNP